MDCQNLQIISRYKSVFVWGNTLTTMGELQKDALDAYNRIKAERGDVTFIDAFVAGAEWKEKQMSESPRK